MPLKGLTLRFLFCFLNNVYQQFSSSCGLQIYVWILILYLVIGYSICDIKTTIRSTGIWYMLLFMYPKIVYIFFSSSFSPLSLSSAHTAFTFDFLFIILPFLSTTSFLIFFSSSTLSFLVLLSPPPLVSLISHATTRLVSLPEYFQFHCHYSCFSPLASGAASIYTLMMRLQTGKSRKSRVKTTSKRAHRAWWQGVPTALHDII